MTAKHTPLQLLRALSNDGLSWAKAEELADATAPLREQLEALEDNLSAWREAEAGEDRRAMREEAVAVAGDALVELHTFLGTLANESTRGTR